MGCDKEVHGDLKVKGDLKVNKCACFERNVCIDGQLIANSGAINLGQYSYPYVGSPIAEKDTVIFHTIGNSGQIAGLDMTSGANLIYVTVDNPNVLSTSIILLTLLLPVNIDNAYPSYIHTVVTNVDTGTFTVAIYSTAPAPYINPTFNYLIC